MFRKEKDENAHDPLNPLDKRECRNGDFSFSDMQVNHVHTY